MALYSDVLLSRFPVEPREGWSKVLISPETTEQRTYNDEPVIFQNGILIRSEFNISCKVTPFEASRLAELCDRAQGRPFLFQDPWDFKAPGNPVIGPNGDYKYGAVVQTGHQQCPVVVRGLIAPDGTRSQYVKPIFYAEDLVVAGVPTNFDPYRRIGFTTVATVGDNVESADFKFLLPVRIEALELPTRYDPNKTIAVGPECDEGDLVQMTCTLTETYDWLVDDTFLAVGETDDS